MKLKPLYLGVLCVAFTALLLLPIFTFGQAKQHQMAVGKKKNAHSGGQANAGPDRTVFVNEPLALDGTATTAAFDGLQADGRHSIQWDFGYGGFTYEGGLTAPIAYPEPGVYTATLTRYTAGGVSASDTAQITVNAITLGAEDILSDTGNVATNTTNLQAAIDTTTAIANQVITLPATFVANPIVLKHRTSGTYVTIRTANHASLPNGTSGVSPGDASNMAKLETSTNASIITTPSTSSNPARYYNFIGIHLRKTTSTTAYTNAFVNLGFQDETALNQLPNHIIFDRCYFDGGSTTSNTLRGIAIRASDLALVNNYFHRFKGVAIETQAVLWLMGERVNLTNNFLEGATENFMSGGGDPSISNHVPTDLVFRRNHVKKDLGWRSGDAAYYGTDMSVKNSIEFKLLNRGSVQGNYIENHWIEDQNYAITVTVRNQEGVAPWSVVQYLDFSHNIMHKIGNGMSIAAEDDLQPAVPTNHILVRHNIFRGVAFYSGQHLLFLLGGGQGSAPLNGFDKVSIVQNSTDLNGDPLGGQGKAIDFDTSVNNTNFTFSGNIVQGFINSGAGGGSTNLAALQAAASTTSFSATKNGFYRSKAGVMPADNSTVSLIADVKYTNLAGFDLSLAGDSPFLTTGFLGARSGADVGAVNVLTEHAVSRSWPSPDASAPVISSVSHGTPAATSATVTWTTDDFADSRVFYDTTSRPSDTDGSTYAFSTTLDPSSVTSHSVGLTGLTASTTYFYKVRSANASSLVSFSSQGSFTTASGLSDFVTDSFTVSSDTTMASHTPSVGGAVTIHPGAAYVSTATIDAATDRLYPLGTTAYFYAASPPSADYYVQGDYHAASIISVNAAICARMNTSTDTMYAVRLNNGTSWELRRIVGGSAATIASSTNQLPTVGNFKTVKLDVSGTGATVTLKVYIDGVEEISFSDTDALRIVATGKAGVRFSGATTSSTGFHLDNFSAR